MFLAKWLTYPLTRDMALDDPNLTNKRVYVIQNKKFLYQIYQEWYTKVISFLPSVDGLILELGSGAGFLQDYIPGLITSDVFPCSSIRLISDGRAMPFNKSTLRAIVMTNVFHHIPDVHSFLTEAERCLKVGGSIIMIEPWVTPWSQFIYGNIHHEPIIINAANWEFPTKGPLSSANAALPWIVFQRDKSKLKKEFPNLHIHRIELFMPIRYILSGGLAWRSFAPGWSFKFWKWTEEILNKWMDKIALFALIIIEKKP